MKVLLETARMLLATAIGLIMALFAALVVVAIVVIIRGGNAGQTGAAIGTRLHDGWWLGLLAIWLGASLYLGVRRSRVR